MTKIFFVFPFFSGSNLEKFLKFIQIFDENDWIDNSNFIYDSLIRISDELNNDDIITNVLDDEKFCIGFINLFKIIHKKFYFDKQHINWCPLYFFAVIAQTFMSSYDFKIYCLDYEILNLIAGNFIINHHFPSSCLMINHDSLSFGMNNDLQKSDVYSKYLLCTVSLLQLEKSNYFNISLRHQINERCKSIIIDLPNYIQFEIYIFLSMILLYLKSEKDEKNVKILQSNVDFTINYLQSVSSIEKEDQLNYEFSVNLIFFYLNNAGLMLNNIDILMEKRGILFTCLKNLHSSYQSNLIICLTSFVQTKLIEDVPNNKVLMDFKFINPNDFEPEIQIYVRRLVTMINNNFIKENICNYYNNVDIKKNPKKGE